MPNSHKPPYWVGFDLGGTKMMATVFDGSFQALGRERKRTKGHTSQDEGLERILKTIRKAIEGSGLEPKQISGIGLGFPGPIDMERGRVLEAVNLGWKNMPLKDAVEREFGCGALIANDVDVGVYGEYRFGAARGARCALGVFPGTGIGGGCVYEGKILRGKFASCMEIGHIQINPHGKLCGCGHYGCLETEASRLAIAAEAAKAAYRGESPHLREHIGVDLDEIRSGQLAEAIAAGDTVVQQIVQRAAEKIGMTIGNLVTTLCPDVVVLGGGLVEAMPKLFVETVWKTAKETVMPPFAELFKVVAAELGDDANVLGAAAWAAEGLTGSRHS
jgi:glucokinase